MAQASDDNALAAAPIATRDAADVEYRRRMPAHDPELSQLIGVFPSFEVQREALPALRAQIDQLVPPYSLPPEVVWEERHVPGPAGSPDVRLLIFRPVVPRGRSALLHIHGGGTIVGSPEMSQARCVALAVELGCPVISVDYRLAPETAAPSNVEDCYAALAWLHARADEFGFDPQRIAVLGESAGGLLAAALALMARDRGEHVLCFQALIYPMLDDRTALDEQPSATGEHIWTRDANRFAWNCLLDGQCGAPDPSGYAVPARAQSLRDLPPTFMAVGSLDLFVEEDLAFASRLAREGVPVEIHVYPGAFHAFDLAVHADVTRRFSRDLLDALKRALA